MQKLGRENNHTTDYGMVMFFAFYTLHFLSLPVSQYVKLHLILFNAFRTRWTRLLYAPEMIIIAKNGNGINSVTTSDCSELSLITLKKCIVTLNCPEDF